MHVTGIIAEYNPFHNGHRYQIEQIDPPAAYAFLVVLRREIRRRMPPQNIKLLRHGIKSALAPGIAPQQPPQSQPHAAEKPEPFDNA